MARVSATHTRRNGRTALEAAGRKTGLRTVLSLALQCVSTYSEDDEVPQDRSCRVVIHQCEDDEDDLDDDQDDQTDAEDIELTGMEAKRADDTEDC
jgi:ADP-ribose pyrophosphatase YjhB (NUDIX family)